MGAGFSGRTSPAKVKRKASAALLALPELRETPEQRSTRGWVEAAERSEAFAWVASTGIQIEQGVVDVLEQSGPVGEDHKALLRLMALSLTAGLLDEEAMRECHRACPSEEWLDAEPRRVAWSVAVGGGKTLTAASLCRGVADLVTDDPELKGPLSRGVIYSCRTHKLLTGMLQALELMGVPRELVGVFHGTTDTAKESVPSISREEISRFPILLTTQVQLRNGSARHDRHHGDRKDSKVTLEELLVWRGKDRLCVWDEAFQSALAESAKTEALTMAVGSLQKAVRDLGPDEVLVLQEKNDDKRRPADVLRRDDGMALVSILSGIQGPVVRTVKEAVKGSKPKTIRLGAIEESVVERIKAVAGWLREGQSPGPADALEALAEMVSAGGLSVSVLPGKDDRHTIVQPRVVISDRLKRLVILDAGYTTNVIARMDESVQLASGAQYAGRELTSKLFDQVKVHFYPGHSGRGNTRKGEGLGNTRTRLKLIREQVERISRVPLGETSLVVTFGKRDGDGIDFKAEIECCMDEKCPGWRDDVNGNQRVTVITWGEHVGSNDWRHCRHIFFVGVLRRGWTGDLSGEAFAAVRGDTTAYQLADPRLIEANQAAQEIMQAIGRGHARITVNGHAGELTVHLPYKESASPYRGMAPCEGSPLWEDLKRMMPGCVLISSASPPKKSGAGLVAEVAAQVLDALAADQITTIKLKPLVMAQLPGGGAGVTDKVFKGGLKTLAEANAKRAAAGEPVWVKPTPSSRSWVKQQQTAA